MTTKVKVANTLVRALKLCKAEGLTNYEMYCLGIVAFDNVRGTTVLDVDMLWQRHTGESIPSLKDLSPMTFKMARWAVSRWGVGKEAVAGLQKHMGLGLKLATEAIENQAANPSGDKSPSSEDR